MTRCKDALNDSACGKIVCCAECTERNGCEISCEFSPEDCGSSILKKNAVDALKTDTADVINMIADLTVQKKRIEQQEKEMKEKLLEAMEKYGVKKFENEIVKFVYVAPTTRKSIDSAKLKKELPDIAEKYSKISNISASVRIEVK